MSRDLTDLMERAVSAAPPEPHHAADITHLAARRQRRRTTFGAAGAALAVAVVAGATIGLTQNDSSTPEPAGPVYLRNQTVDGSSAMPLNALPGYRGEPWTQPSVQQLGRGRGPYATYRQVDARGRLIVQDFPHGPHGEPRDLIYDGPGQAPRAVQQPPSPGSTAGTPVGWMPSFLGDGRLWWAASGPIAGSANDTVHVTDLDGGHDVLVHTTFHIAKNGTVQAMTPWVSGDHIWFTSYDSMTLESGVSHSLYTATFSGPVTKVADRVAVADVNDGVAAWVTTDGHVVTESAAGGPQHPVNVPITPGCHMSSTSDLQGTGTSSLAVSRSAIALSETCGSGKASRQDILAFDPAGRLLVHVTGLDSFNPSLGLDSLVFRGAAYPGFRQVADYRYDLVTGSLARLSHDRLAGSLEYPQAAGDYVLWYDDTGGHVGEFTG